MDLIPQSKDTIWQPGLKGKSINLLLTGQPTVDRNKHWLTVKG
jgi:hypothetical protein